MGLPGKPIGVKEGLLGTEWRLVAGTKPNYQGSQFRKFLFQVCQDHDMVKRILWSPDTLVAYTPVEEGDEVIDFVENLAIQVFRPRFNIKDR